MTAHLSSSRSCGSDLLGGRLGASARRFRERVGEVASRRAARRAARDDREVGRAAARRCPSGLDARRVFTIPNGVDLDRFAPVDRRAARHPRLAARTSPLILFPARRHAARSATTSPRRRSTRCRRRAARRRGCVHSTASPTVTSRRGQRLRRRHRHVVARGLAQRRQGSTRVLTPVVAVDVGDIRERVSGVTGCAVVPGEPAALAVALRAALGTPRPDEGRRRVADSHSRASPSGSRTSMRPSVARR